MSHDLNFLDEVRSQYFDETDSIRPDKIISIDELATLEQRLFKTLLKGENSIIYEVTESYIDELKNRLKQPSAESQNTISNPKNTSSCQQQYH
ncbi:MAG: hypothetical protein K0M56_00965 [Kaistella sp.]|nr:hypothetical protein [Kaistella sp.]